MAVRRSLGRFRRTAVSSTLSTRSSRALSAGTAVAFRVICSQPSQHTRPVSAARSGAVSRVSVKSRVYPSRSAVQQNHKRCLSAAALAQHNTRSDNFNRVTDEDLAYFKSTLGDAGVVTDADALAALNKDWLGNWSGASKLALRPATTQEVSAILKYCNERRLAVVPQGGNTGLVGGSVPLFDEIIVSLARMNKIESLDQYSGVVTAQAGVVLQVLQDHLDDAGFIMPLDLGAKGSCMIGGNVATNAGGIRFIRYGSLHGSVLGLEAVLADGTILDNMNVLKKDNTGYDLKQLFIGSEGTLGIITRVCIAAPYKPKSVQLAFLGLSSYEDVLKTMRRARSELGEIISAIEFLDKQSLELVLEHLDGTRDPLPDRHEQYMLVETSGSNMEHDTEKLSAFLESVMEDGLVHDGTLAQDETQIKAVWTLREGIGSALMHAGSVYKYDVSLPVSNMYDLVEEMKERLTGKAKVIGYGHLGDENLHLNISVKQHSDDVFSLIEPFVFERVQSYRGSVSAEHGIGQCKVPYLGFSKTPAMIATMRAVKKLFDPNGILNPYKMLSDTESSSRK